MCMHQRCHLCQGKKKKVSKQQSEQLLFFYTLCERLKSSEVQGCAEHLLILSWVVALFVCNYETNLCTPSTSIHCCSACCHCGSRHCHWTHYFSFPMIWINDIFSHQISQNVLPKSDLFSFPAPTELNVAVSLERIMFAWSKVYVHVEIPIVYLRTFWYNVFFLVWFFNNLWYELRDLLKQK